MNNKTARILKRFANAHNLQEKGLKASYNKLSPDERTKARAQMKGKLKEMKYDHKNKNAHR